VINRSWPLVLGVSCSLLISGAGCYAQTTPPPVVAAAPIAPCARDPDIGSLKGVIKSGDSSEVKIAEVLIAAQSSVTNGWNSISRKDDLGMVIKSITASYLARFDTPIPDKDLEADAAKLSTALGKALVAVCGMQDADTATIKATAFAAADMNVKTEEAKTVAATPIEINSSGYGFGEGDRLRFYTTTDGFQMVRNGEPTAAAIAPCGSKFRITALDKSGENALGYFYFVPTDKHPAKPRIARTHCAKLEYPIPTSVDTETLYQVSIDRLSRAPAFMSGFQFGVLVAPYKFHFSDDSTTPSATLGGYLGFRLGNPAVDWTPVVTVGLGAVTETVEPAGEGDKKPAGTLASISAAAGALLRIRKAGGFTVGILVGGDWTGQKARYRYDGKLWAAISFGVALSE
jgi:hypothetical protein